MISIHIGSSSNSSIVVEVVVVAVVVVVVVKLEWRSNIMLCFYSAQLQSQAAHSSSSNLSTYHFLRDQAIETEPTQSGGFFSGLT
jgi:hypothetical protein